MEWFCRHLINGERRKNLIILKFLIPPKWINSFPNRVPLQHYQAAIFFKRFKISIMCEWSFASNLMAVFSCNKVEEALIMLTGFFYETWHPKIKCHDRLNVCQSSLLQNIIPNFIHECFLVVKCNAIECLNCGQWFCSVSLGVGNCPGYLLTVVLQHNGRFHYVLLVHWTNINACILEHKHMNHFTFTSNNGKNAKFISESFYTISSFHIFIHLSMNAFPGGLVRSEVGLQEFWMSWGIPVKPPKIRAWRPAQRHPSLLVWCHSAPLSEQQTALPASTS